MDNALSFLEIPQGYNFAFGTSFSTPCATGTIAAIMTHINKMQGGGSEKKEIYEYLEKGTLDLGDEGYDIYYGNGLISAYAEIWFLLFGISAITFLMIYRQKLKST